MLASTTPSQREPEHDVCTLDSTSTARCVREQVPPVITARPTVTTSEFTKQQAACCMTMHARKQKICVHKPHGGGCANNNSVCATVPCLQVCYALHCTMLPTVQQFYSFFPKKPDSRPLRLLFGRAFHASVPFMSATMTATLSVV